MKWVCQRIASRVGAVNPGGNAHGDRGNGLNGDSSAFVLIPASLPNLSVTGVSP
jgi:hypothetical protein